MAGRKGMGKTRIINEIIGRKVEIQPALNIYHVDTKKRGDFSSKDGIMHISENAPPAFTTAGNRMVWQPLVDDKEEYSKFFLDILNTGLPAIVNIDEAINMRFGTSIPRGLEILLTQARLPGIHVLGGTQEVARSPRQLLSQAQHIICFNLINKYDEQIMRSVYLRLHDRKELGLKVHQFFHIRPDIDDVASFYNGFEELLPLII